MNLKNKYQKFSKITEPKFRRLLRLFALDLTASDTAKLTGVSIRSVNNLYLKLRRRLADECGRQAPLYGIVELDESYLGAKRIRGKRGRGAGGKTIVFGILKRGTRFIPRLFPMLPKQRCKRSLEVMSVSGVSSIPTVGAVIKDWLTWVLPNISGYIMVTMSLFVVRGILTVLNLFGAMPSIAWCNLTGCRNIRFTCI